MTRRVTASTQATRTGPKGKPVYRWWTAELPTGNTVHTWATCVMEATDQIQRQHSVIPVTIRRAAKVTR